MSESSCASAVARGLQAEHQRGREAAGVGAMEHAAGVRAGGQQPADRLAVGVEHARVLVDPQAGEGEGDRGDDLDHVVRRVDQRRGVEPAAGSSSPASHWRLNSSSVSRAASPG